MAVVEVLKTVYKGGSTKKIEIAQIKMYLICVIRECN